MDSLVKIYLERSRNELSSAKILLLFSSMSDLKRRFEIVEDSTFFSGVISHSYYAIFYAVKAILLTKNIKTVAPEVHKKTYDEFKRVFVDSGLLDVALLSVYKKMLIRADSLLGIFKDEKWKRGHFTYQTIPQANEEPAKESLKNATLFLKNILLVIDV